MDLKDKKILMITTTDNMIWQFLIPHINHLQELGATVECVCARTGWWFDELKDAHNFTMHEFNFARNPFKLANIKCYKKLCKLQEDKHFDLVYCQQPVGGLMGRLIARKFKTPCIYTAHGFHFFKGCALKNKLLYKTTEQWLSKYTDALVTINEEDYKSALKMKAKKVYKINGIGTDSAKIKSEDFNKSAFRTELGLSDSDKVVLTVSELNKNKNYITMLDTIKILADQDKSIKFVACGRGVWEQKIKNYAKKIGVYQNCIFLGYRKDVAKIMQISDIFFHASFREGLTLSVMEAMYFALPCVVSNVRGNRDLIKDGEGGYICPPKDAIGFAEAISKILSDPALSQQFGQFNQNESKNYTVEVIKTQLEQIYKEM